MFFELLVFDTLVKQLLMYTKRFLIPPRVFKHTAYSGGDAGRVIGNIGPNCLKFCPVRVWQYLEQAALPCM